MFAFQASTGAFLGSTSFAGYNNIRKFVVVDGVLYAGVGTKEAPPAKSGRVLRWQGSVATPFAFHGSRHYRLDGIGDCRA